MKVGFSTEVLDGWLSRPIALGLLISVVVHFAFALLVQTNRASSSRQVIVINARLQAAAPQSIEKVVVLTEPQNPEPVLPEPEKRVLADKPVLTAMSPTATLAVKQPEKQPAQWPEKLATEQEAQSSAQTTIAEQPVERRNDAPGSIKHDAAEVTPAKPLADGLPSLPINIDSNWYKALQVDDQPKAIGKIEPRYPEEATRRNLEGTLKLLLKIDDLGRVQSAEVVEAVPPGVFDEAALTAFRAARFRPAMKDGRPVRYQAYMRVDFKLQD